MPDADWRRGLIPEATNPAKVRLRFVRDGRGGLAKVPLVLPEDLDAGRPDLWGGLFELVAKSLPLIEQVEDEYVVEDARFQAFLKEQGQWPRLMSRADYERLAIKMGFQPLADDDVSEWGDYAFPEYRVDVCRRLRLQQTYAVDLRRARDAEYAPQEKERLRRRREEEARLTEALKDAPVSRTYERLVAGCPAVFLCDNGLHVVVSRRDRVITEDDPSLHGSHLLGCEGARHPGGGLEAARRRVMPSASLDQLPLQDAGLLAIHRRLSAFDIGIRVRLTVSTDDEPADHAEYDRYQYRENQ